MGNRESSSTFESRTTSDHPDRHKAEAGHKHIVLLGDSTFDNKAYTRGGPCVVEQLTLILEQEMAREREQAKRKKEAAATAIDPAAFEPPSEKQQQAHEQEGEQEQEQEQEQERQKVDSKQDEDVESKEEESKEEEEIEEESKATAKDKGKTMKATLLAEDGAVLAGLASQLDQVPADATHLILSIGGNDLLAKTSILSQRCDSVQHGLSKLQLVMSDLEQRYETGIRTVLERFPRQRLLLCSVYTGCYRPFGNTKYQQEAINVAVAIFADIIVRVAHRLALPVLDFRRFMTEPGDFANPIEPSSQGAAKIAAHIFHIVQSHTWVPALPLVYPLQFPAAADPLRAFSSA